MVLFQAHCFARYTLLQVCLEAGNEFVTITEKSGEDGKPDLLFKLDPKKIDSVGKPAVGAFLRKLQVGVSSSVLLLIFDFLSICWHNYWEWRGAL